MTIHLLLLPRDVLACRVGLGTPRRSNNRVKTAMWVALTIFLQQRHYVIGDTLARRARVRPLAAINTSEPRTV